MKMSKNFRSLKTFRSFCGMSFPFEPIGSDGILFTATKVAVITPVSLAETFKDVSARMIYKDLKVNNIYIIYHGRPPMGLTAYGFYEHEFLFWDDYTQNELRGYFFETSPPPDWYHHHGPKFGLGPLEKAQSWAVLSDPVWARIAVERYRDS